MDPENVTAGRKVKPPTILKVVKAAYDYAGIFGIFNKGFGRTS